MNKTLGFAVVGALLPGLVLAQASNRFAPTCLNYWVVGDSGCNSGTTSQTTVTKPSLPPPVMEQSAAQPVSTQQPQQAATLDQQIDDFMENHGKPPREFVAFHLQPTLENALQWVYKYKEMLKRNIALTRAWAQAEAIYDQSNPEEQAEIALASKQNMAVPDFGVTVPNMPGLDPLTPAPVPTTPVAPKAPLVQQAKATTPNPFNSVQPLEEGRIGGATDTLEIDYYFSAECPYCEKFEPILRQVLSEIEVPLRVTCVDLTPSGQLPENINGKIDCDWRPGGATEMQRMGIRTTPSLIIKRGAGQPLERISGYVEGDSLREHLLKGRGL